MHIYAILVRKRKEMVKSSAGSMEKENKKWCVILEALFPFYRRHSTLKNESIGAVMNG